MKVQEPQPPQRVHTATTPSHTRLFTFWPTSGPVPSECFIPSHCHILSKKASLPWLAEVMDSLLEAHVFHPSITRNELKRWCWLSHTQRHNQSIAPCWVRGTAQSTPARHPNTTCPHLCYLILLGEAGAIKGSCDHGGHR